MPTHLDSDHAGGIIDFPWAKIHTLRPEFESAMSRNTFAKKHRYRTCHWNSDTKWEIHDEDWGENWFGFKSVRVIKVLPPEILLIPLYGHTEGHMGIAVQFKVRVAYIIAFEYLIRLQASRKNTRQRINELCKLFFNLNKQFIFS